MPQVIDIALRTNPITRISWSQARVAAARFGQSRSELFPTIDADMAVTRSQTLASSGGNGGGSRTQYGPGVSLSYLLFDFGGRSGSIESARELAIAANLSHNTVIQNTVLDVETAIFDYMATRALRDAQQTAVREAETVVTSAEERRRVGVATIADVLQARTARSAVQLTLETLEGQLQIARGGVAIAMGLPANTSIDIPQVRTQDSIAVITESVDSIIALAVRSRPDLAASQAEALSASADVRAARSLQLPALTLGGNSAYTRNSPGASGATYNISVGVQLPIFNGFRNQYALRAAQDLSIAADARTQLTRQQVVFDVFSAYYTLQTAGQHVRTAADLLASALESEQVALARYREGVGTIVDLLIAQTALANARAEDVQAHWQYQTALARLAHDAGVLSVDGNAAIPLNGTR
jgi:outer membrane protein TolC